MRQTLIFAAVALWIAAAGDSDAGIIIPDRIGFTPAATTLPAWSVQPDQTIATKAASKLGVPAASGPDAAIFRPPSSLGPDTLKNPSAVAAEFFNAVLPDVAAVDFTTRALSEPFVVAKQRVQANGQKGDIEEESRWFRMNRFVKTNRKIYGPGSSAVVEVKRGQVFSTVLRWDKIIKESEHDVIIVPLTAANLRKHLASEFRDADEEIIEVIDGPEIVYYDDRHMLTPVYRVSVDVNRRDGSHSDRMDVFLPVDGTAPAPAALEFPGDCDDTLSTSFSGMRVDRYVSRDDDNQWIANGNRFLNRLLSAPQNLASVRFCEIRLKHLKEMKDAYVDSANIALIETHGLPGQVKVKGGWMTLTDAGGYGRREDGLRLLILHSCQTVTTPADDIQWADSWFKVFKGLHTILGYRTTMVINDGVSAAFADHLRSEPLIRSWFAEIVASNEYRKGEPAPPAGGTKTQGRGAAITLCDREYSTRNDLSQVTEPTCLVSLWIRDKS